MTPVNLAVEKFGNPGAPPLLIVHGFFASSRNWRLIAQKLALDFLVYVLDMRNHGASPHHPCMDYPAMVEDLLYFMDQEGLTDAHILGHSMGGKIAMWLALNHPERVSKLVVVDIAPVSYAHHFDGIINPLKQLPLATLKNRKQAEELLEADVPDISYRQFLLQNLSLRNSCYSWRIDLDIFAKNADYIADFPDTAHLQPYQGSALFIAGSDSTYLKKQDISLLFPNAVLTMIAKAGHWVHTQQPEAFLRAVQGYLTGD